MGMNDKKQTPPAVTEVAETVTTPFIPEQKGGFVLEAINFDNYEQEAAASPPLPIRDGVDASIIEFRYFRHDELERLDGSKRAGFWIPVRLGNPVLQYNFEDFFVEQNHPAYPFDESGTICKGIIVAGKDGHRTRELYLAARPAVARAAEQQYRAMRAAKSFHEGNRSALGDKGLNQSHNGTQVIKAVDPGDYRQNMMTSQRWAGVSNSEVR